MKGLSRRMLLASAGAGLFTLSGIAAAAADAPPVQLIIAGDSTAAEYGPERAPRAGWGMMLQPLFDDGVAVVNLAKSGRSTRSFIDQGLWNEVTARIRPGDHVLIQFGHNDQRRDDPARYTDPAADYPANLTRMVGDVRARGGLPVLLTPVARRLFEGGRMVQTHEPYLTAMRQVAATHQVPLIDVTVATMAHMEGFGQEGSKALYMVFPPGTYPAYPDGSEDNTHFSEQGAQDVARLVADGLRQAGLPIARHLKTGL